MRHHLVAFIAVLFPFAIGGCDAFMTPEDGTHDDVCPDSANRGLYSGLVPTALPVDCRCLENHDRHVSCITPLSDLLYETDGQRLGEGPILSDQGSAPEVRYGELWPDRGAQGSIIVAQSVYTKQPGLIVEVDLETRSRRVVSGVYVDPQYGFKTVGAGPEMGEPGYAYRGPDDMIYVYSISMIYVAPNNVPRNRIFRVHPETGDRTLVWERGLDTGFPQCMNGIPEDSEILASTPPAPLQLQLEGEGFAIGADGSFYLTTIQNGYPGPGRGLIRVAADGSSCDVVTMGPGEAGNNYVDGIGEGWPLDSYIEEVKELPDGRLLVNAGGSLLEVDKVTGDRKRIGSGVPIGEMAWDATRDMLLITGVKNPRSPDIYFWDEATDKTWRQVYCPPSQVVEEGHPVATACPLITWGPLGPSSLSEGMGWITPSGDYLVQVVGTEFILVELSTMNSIWLSY
ncbi:MAG: hypothetical protein ACI9MC_000884 [Kiritimatiellia bacterium]|jgi:hypothetical protein